MTVNTKLFFISGFTHSTLSCKTNTTQSNTAHL